MKKPAMKPAAKPTKPRILWAPVITNNGRNPWIFYNVMGATRTAAIDEFVDYHRSLRGQENDARHVILEGVRFAKVLVSEVTPCR